MDEFADLLARAREGDQDAIRALHDRYEQGVMKAARRRLNPGLRRRFDTLDLAQSVFVEVIRALPRFEDRGEASFRAWLRVMVDNKVRDKLRKFTGRDQRPREARIQSGAEFEARAPSPASQAEHREARRNARDAVADLDETLRSILLLRLEEGLTFEQIAERLNLSSAEAARKRYARGLVRLHEGWDRPSRSGRS
jgi:RNA polymerase sigma-70 factor (ECF subfamily)